MRDERSVQVTEASTEGLIFFCIQFVVMNMLSNILEFCFTFTNNFYLIVLSFLMLLLNNTFLIFDLFKYELMKLISNALHLYIQLQHLVSLDHDSTAAILNQALCGIVQHRRGYQ